MRSCGIGGCGSPAGVFFLSAFLANATPNFLRTTPLFGVSVSAPTNFTLTHKFLKPVQILESDTLIKLA